MFLIDYSILNNKLILQKRSIHYLLHIEYIINGSNNHSHIIENIYDCTILFIYINLILCIKNF